MHQSSVDADCLTGRIHYLAKRDGLAQCAWRYILALEAIIYSRLLAGLSALALISSPAMAQVKPGEPPLTAQTMRSGGPIDPVQAKMHIALADLTIELDPQKQTLKGLAVLIVKISGPTDRLVLDLDRNLVTSSILLDGKALSHSDWSNPDGRLTIQLRKKAVAGQRIAVSINYAGTPHVAVRAPWDDGIVWSKTPDGQPWFATTAQGYGCDLYWPCIDHPQGEVDTVDVHLITPAGLVGLSNGVSKGKTVLSDGRIIWHWESGSINPYLVAFNVGPFVEISDTYHSQFGNSFPMQLWVLKGHEDKAKQLFTEFAPTLDFFEAKIGPFPFGDQKMGVVEVPYLGMEHQTINGYGNGFKPSPEGFDWLFQHEFSHEWFGNQLTAADWDDFWLHEGFGNYMQPLYGLWREGQARYDAMMMSARVRIMNRAPIVSGKPMTAEDVYEDGKGGPGGDIYYKGEWVLHTLRNLIGDDAFFAATRKLVYGRSDPKPGNFSPRFGTTAEFERDVNEAAGRDLSWFFAIYLHKAALPELIEERVGDRLSLHWKTPDDLPFPMPVEVEIDGKVRSVAMPDGRADIAVPAGAHLVIDPMAKILRVSPALERMRASGSKITP